MTSIINNSNSNSSLVNTISASESAMNPNVYSTQPVHYPAATTYVRTDISSGVVGASKTITFNLLKYGICQQILLCYTKNFTDNTGTLFQNDLWNIIERVELLSSSKVIATLTNNDLMAQFSNLESAQYAPVADSALDARTAAQEHQYVVPLVWGFSQRIATNINLQFNEPMSIRVKFGPNLTEKNAGTVANVPITDVFLKMRYKAYNEKDFAQVVAENYEKPELNVLSSSFYDESSKTFTNKGGANAVAAGSATIKVELKNTDCVNDFYVYVRRISGDAYNINTGKPVPLTKVLMTASGQEIFNLSDKEQAYTRLCENGFSIATASAGNTGFANEWLSNTVKIQTGLWQYSGTEALSNTMSLRELNNPVIECTFPTAAIGANGGDDVYEMVVVEDCTKIFSCTSANGRLNVALSN